MKSAADKYLGGWMSPETSQRVPDLRREFDMNRDPLIRKQLLDDEKTEAQRRREQVEGETGRGSGMVEKDQPKFQLRPPPETARPVDRKAFQDRWIIEQREAVLARAEIRRNDESPERSQTPSHTEPSR